MSDDSGMAMAGERGSMDTPAQPSSAAESAASFSGPTSSRRGLFLCLEGVDGAGKSTQLAALIDWLRDRRLEPLLYREPGGTEAGERLRALLLDPATRLSPSAEMLLYMASRAQLVAEVIRPALAAGRLVVGDRYLWSTLAYQGYAAGLGAEIVWQVGTWATGGLLPDWTGILDLDIATASARRAQSSAAPDRIESRSADYHAAVRLGFLTEAARHPDRVTVIDAAPAADEVQRVLRQEVTRVLTAAGWA